MAEVQAHQEVLQVKIKIHYITLLLLWLTIQTIRL